MGVYLAREARFLLAAALSGRCPRRFLSWVNRLSLLGVRVDRAASSCQVAAEDAREQRFQPLVSVEDVGCVDRARFSQSLLSCQERSDHWSWLCQLRSHQLEDLFHGSEWPCPEEVVLLGFTTCLGTRGYLLRLAMSISALAGGSTRTEPWSGGSTLAAPLPCKQQSYTVGAYWAQKQLVTTQRSWLGHLTFPRVARMCQKGLRSRQVSYMTCHLYS